MVLVVAKLARVVICLAHSLVLNLVKIKIVQRQLDNF
jgi:hypothetical protein